MHTIHTKLEQEDHSIFHKLSTKSIRKLAQNSHTNKQKNTKFSQNYQKFIEESLHNSHNILTKMAQNCQTNLTKVSQKYCKNTKFAHKLKKKSQINITKHKNY